MLFALPWLDRSAVRSARFRPICRPALLGLVLSCVLLALVGKHHATGAWMLVGRLSALYYFGYFLVILPLASRLEKPRPLPASITSAGGDA